MRYFFLSLLLIAAQLCKAQYEVIEIDSSHISRDPTITLNKISFRGLYVFSNQVFWISGSRGVVGFSDDAGEHIKLSCLKGYEKSDFRDISVINDTTVIMMSSGTPAYILKTTDKGKNWKQVYASYDTSIFLDAMDFYDNQKGAIVADPVNGFFQIMITYDGGEKWSVLPSHELPAAYPGEAVFAASGTSIRWLNKDELVFVSGGSHSRIFKYNIIKKHWHIMDTDSIMTDEKKLRFTEGRNSQGLFSITHYGNKLCAVGGDYTKDSLITQKALVLDADLALSSQIENTPSGYRSCVAYNPLWRVLIAVGTNGIDIGKEKWNRISDSGYHVISCSKQGNAVILAGGNGRIAFLKKVKK